MKYNQQFNQQQALRFHHFTRKGWALFACLGRVVTISVLSVATLKSASAATDDIATTVERQPAGAFAGSGDPHSGINAEEDEPDEEKTLGNLEVTGSLAPLATGQGVRLVSVLTHDAIQSVPIQSINDLLKMVASVDVRQRGPIGAQTDVSIRGGTQEQIAILLNGINICDPQTGHNTLDLPCDVSDIMRIEVLEGPAGRIYGTSSLLGAINIVTYPGTRNEEAGTGNVKARMEGGSFGYFSSAASISSNLVPSSSSNHHALSASYTRSDGYSRSKAGHLNSDYEGGKAFYQGGYSLPLGEAGKGSLSWHTGVSIKGFGSNTFYSAKYDEQFEKTIKLYTALQGDILLNRCSAGGKTYELHLKPAVYWNHGKDRFELIRGSEDKVPYNFHRTNIVGLNLNSWFEWQLGRTAIGAEFRNEDIVSTNLGEPLREPFSHYKSGLNRSQLSIHAEHNILLKQLTLSAGFVAIKNTGNEMPFKAYPGIDLRLRLNQHWKLYASYNESLRMPSFTELYYSVGGHKADKNLKPEEMRAVEGGVKVEDERWSVVGKVFYHHCSNIIDWVMDTRDPEGTWQSVNHTKVNTFGQEITVNCQFPIFAQASVPAGRTINCQLSYCHLHQQKDEEPYLQSQYSLEYLRHKLSAMLQCPINSHLSATVSYRYQDRTGSYTSTEGIVTDYRPYSVVDARVAWKQPGTESYVEANNLTSTHYIDYGNVPQPGCWIIVGCKKTLNYKKRIDFSQ